MNPPDVENIDGNSDLSGYDGCADIASDDVQIVLSPDVTIVFYNYSMLTFGDRNGQLVVSNFQDGDTKHIDTVLIHGSASRISHFCWASDFSKICVSHTDGFVRLLLGKGTLLWLKKVEFIVEHIAWSFDGNLILLASGLRSLNPIIRCIDCDGHFVINVSLVPLKSIRKGYFNHPNDACEVDNNIIPLQVQGIAWFHGHKRYAPDLALLLIQSIELNTLVQVMNGCSDLAPIVVKVNNYVGSCVAWCSNGTLLAMGGCEVATPVVYIISCTGEIFCRTAYASVGMHVSVTSLAWEDIFYDHHSFDLNFRIASVVGGCTYVTNIQHNSQLHWLDGDILMYHGYLANFDMDAIVFWSTKTITDRKYDEVLKCLECHNRYADEGFVVHLFPRLLCMASCSSLCVFAVENVRTCENMIVQDVDVNTLICKDKNYSVMIMDAMGSLLCTYPLPFVPEYVSITNSFVISCSFDGLLYFCDFKQALETVLYDNDDGPGLSNIEQMRELESRCCDTAEARDVCYETSGCLRHLCSDIGCFNELQCTHDAVKVCCMSVYVQFELLVVIIIPVFITRGCFQPFKVLFFNLHSLNIVGSCPLNLSPVSPQTSTSLYGFGIFPVASVKNVALNCNARRISVINSLGVLTIHDIEVESSTVVDSYKIVNLHRCASIERENVWSFCWSGDDPDMFVLCEESRLIVYRCFKVEESELCEASICLVVECQLTLVSFPSIASNPLDPSVSRCVFRRESRVFRDAKLIVTDPFVDIEEAFTYAIKQGRSVILLRLLAQRALKKLDFNMARQIFVACDDLLGLRIVSKVESLPLQLQSVISNALTSNIASSELIAVSEIDLVLDIYKGMHDWFSIWRLLRDGSSDSSDRLSNAFKCASDNIGNYFADRQQWSQAIMYYGLSTNWKKLIYCNMMVMDFDAVDELLATIPNGDPFLFHIASTFSCSGHMNRAFSAYLRCGDDGIKQATFICEEMCWFDRALGLATIHRSSIDKLNNKESN